MKMTLVVLVLLIFLGVVGATLAFLYQQSQPLSPPYEITIVERRTLADKAIAAGSIVPQKEIAIKPQVQGVLERLFVEPGQKVKAGDALARIKVVAEPLEVNRAVYHLKKAQLEYDAAAEELRLTKELLKRGSSNARELNGYQLQFDIAKANVQSARSNLELIRAGVSKSAEHTATLVRATVDGTILDRPVEEGNFVIESSGFNEGTTIVTIADMQRLLFKGMVTEIEAGRLQEGMPLDITIGALPEKRYTAILEFISPKANTADGSVKFEIRAALNLSSLQAVRAGYSATADIIFARHDDVLAIPERYLAFHEGKTRILLQVAPDISEWREVTTGISDGIYIEITSNNLHAGDRIVVPSEP